MPGICGIISLHERPPQGALDQMLKALRHRGSPEESRWEEGPFAIGITGGTIVERDDTKLLIDTPQKITSFPDFNTYQSPYAYVQITPKSLIMGRDALGMRPLFWTFQNGYFIFSSELKGLIHSNLFTLRPDLESLSFYLSLGYFPVNKTPFKDVHKMRPGHRLTFNLDGEIVLRPVFSFSNLMRDSDPNWNAKTFDTFAEEVVKSYHLDPKSTAILEFEAADCPKLYEPLPKLKIPPIEFHKIAEELPQIVWHLDEPLASAKILSFWRLCEEAKHQGKSALLLSTGSLSWLSRHIHRPHLYGEKAFYWGREVLRKLLLSPLFNPWRSRSYFNLLRTLHTHPWHTTMIRNQYMLSSFAIKRLTGGLLRGLDPEIVYHSFPPFEKMGISYGSLLYLHQKTSLIHNYMSQYDRLPLAFGITAHTPYCERPTLEYLAQIPEEQLQGLFRRISTPAFEKALFAKTTLIDTRKAHDLFGQLRRGALVQNGLLEPKALTHYLRANLDHPKNLRILWTLLVLEVWFRLFYESPPSFESPKVTLTELLG